MKRILIMLALLIYCSGALAQQKDIDAIKKLNAEWIASYVTRDTATLSRIFADDIQLTNPSGEMRTKQQMLKALVSPDQKYISTKVDTASVRLFGNIGIINAKVTGVVEAGGKTSTAQVGYMDVYDKRHGRWYAIAAHVTLLSSN
jgi:uncharacterized protein (TIGR02246 family)